MLSKKIIASVLAATTLLSVSPLTSLAAEKKDPVKVQVQTNSKNKNQNVNNNVNASEDGEVTTQGWKKTAVVYALRYGGDALSAILKNLSTKNANLVKKHSGQLADALDRFESNIEARLVDYMIHSLGFSSSSARSIAWAIMFVIG
ncbi:hypothetical protein O0Q50_23175 [Priestia aryabhattai]|uniref:Uncharacterized protein n=1 Tax=Priestia aryabhattai TaxID=412384 RepID=A0AAX6NE39_PRIAR|nr:hypothetical protein [Priestia aryabhattai]MDU9694089.1 hypothetical protein [Priestia aryabhattai]